MMNDIIQKQNNQLNLYKEKIDKICAYNNSLIKEKPHQYVGHCDWTMEKAYPPIYEPTPEPKIEKVEYPRFEQDAELIYYNGKYIVKTDEYLKNNEGEWFKINKDEYDLNKIEKKVEVNYCTLYDHVDSN